MIYKDLSTLHAIASRRHPNHKPAPAARPQPEQARSKTEGPASTGTKPAPERRVIEQKTRAAARLRCPGPRNLSAIRSIPSRSSFPGNSAAINEYPGRNSTSRRPMMICTGVSLSRGASTKRMHASVRAITSVRSFGKSLSMMCIFILFIHLSSAHGLVVHRPLYQTLILSIIPASTCFLSSAKSL